MTEPTTRMLATAEAFGVLAHGVELSLETAAFNWDELSDRHGIRLRRRPMRSAARLSAEFQFPFEPGPLALMAVLADRLEDDFNPWCEIWRDVALMGTLRPQGWLLVSICETPRYDRIVRDGDLEVIGQDWSKSIGTRLTSNAPGGGWPRCSAPSRKRHRRGAAFRFALLSHSHRLGRNGNFHRWMERTPEPFDRDLR